MEEQVRKIIEKFRPYLNADGGDIELLKVEDGIVYVRLIGACAGCSLQDATLKDGLEAILIEEVPEIVEVINVP